MKQHTSSAAPKKAAETNEKKSEVSIRSSLRSPMRRESSAKAEKAPASPKSPSLFRKMKERRTKRDALRAQEAQVAQDQSGFSNDDVDMILELGYESELGRVVGYENLQKLKHEHNLRIGKGNHRHYRTAFGYCGHEDVNAQTRASVMASYAHHKGALLFRTLLTALLTVLIFLLEFPALFGGTYEEFLITYPIIPKGFSTVLLIAACTLSWRQINAGVRSYFNFHPTPYSALGTFLLVTLLYDLVLFFTDEPTLRVNSIGAGLLLTVALCDVMRLTGEIRTVRLLCTEGPKTVLEPTEPRKRKLRQGKKLVKIINDDIDERFYRVRVAEETEGFFRRFNELSSTNRPFHVLLGLAPVVGFLAAFVALLITESFLSAINTFMTVVMLSAPFCAIFSFFHPLCRANKILSKDGCALIGEEAVQEYNESKTVIFPDTDLYASQRCTEIPAKESDDFRQDLRMSAILFCKLGGTLSSVGKIYARGSADASVTFVRLTEQGVEAMIEEKRHILAGSADFLKKYGIRLPRETSDLTLRRTPNVGVMYVAIDGVLKLTYEIEYTEKVAFNTIVNDLASIDTSVAIQSYDPNLNQSFLLANRPSGSTPIRVIKPGRHECDSVLKSSDTGAVAVGDTFDIVYPLHAAHGIQKHRRFGIRLQYVLSAIGAIGGAVLSLTASAEWITPLTVAAYHLCGILVTLAVAHFRLTRRSFRMRKEGRR